MSELDAKMLILESRRLVLTRHTPKNEDKIHTWQNDPELLYMTADSIIFQSRQQTREALERWMDVSRQTIIHLAIHIKKTNELIGFAQIAFIDFEHRRCKVAIVIGQKLLWGQGFGREAISRIVQYCFEELELNRVGAEMYAFNYRSIHAFETAGFQREGVIRENVYKEGRYFDEYCYGLLRREWKP